MSLDGIVVPKGWELVKISNIGDVITGSTPSTSNLEYYGNDFPFYSPSDLNSNIEISRANKGLSHKGLEVARKIPEDSILVQCIGDLGRTNIITKMGACNQQINVIIPDKKMIIPKFAYYWFKSVLGNKEITRINDSSVQGAVYKEPIKNCLVLYPPIPEQRKIVAILSNLDDYINKNKEIVGMMRKNATKIEKNKDIYIII